MNSTTRSLSSAVIAAASMYWFDPVSGRRRRAQLRDQCLSIARRTGRELSAAGRDLAHRIQGLTAQARSVFDDEPLDDAVIAARVRSALGRVLSHPGAIDVSVAFGNVELSGAILAQEYPHLMRAVEGIRGVEQIDDRLGVHENARGISALQGGRIREPPRFELLQDNWSPISFGRM